MKDILNHYRTLVSEALERVYYDEVFEDRGLDLGRRLDCLAGRLARKIRPPRAAAPAPSLEGWQPMGWIGDDRPSFARFEDVDLAPHFAALTDHIAGLMDMRMPQPLPEWLEIRRKDIEAMATIPTDKPWEGPGAGLFYGVPLHLDPDNEDMLRINLEELRKSPSAAMVKDAIANFEAAMQGAFPQRFVAGVDFRDADLVKEFFDAYEGPARKAAEAHRKRYEEPFLEALQRATGFRLDSKVEWREASPRTREGVQEALSVLNDTFGTDASPEPAKDATDD